MLCNNNFFHDAGRGKKAQTAQPFFLLGHTNDTTRAVAMMVEQRGGMMVERDTRRDEMLGDGASSSSSSPL